MEEKNEFKEQILITKTNYINFKKRLMSENNLLEYNLIYYSLYLIVSGITAKYFPMTYNVKLNEYFSIIISIIVLLMSIISKNINYTNRIANIRKSILDIQELENESSEDSSNLTDIKKKYQEIMKKTEIRKDIDYYKTIKESNSIKMDKFKEEAEIFKKEYEKKGLYKMWLWVRENGECITALIPIGLMIICFLIK